MMLSLHVAVQRLATWRRWCVGVVVALSFAMACSLAWPSFRNAAATRMIIVVWVGAICGWLFSAVAEANHEQRLDRLAKKSRGRFVRVPDRR